MRFISVFLFTLFLACSLFFLAHQAWAQEQDCYVAPEGFKPVAKGDRDGDTVVDIKDNCPNIANKNQKDSNDDGIGDICDPDGDAFPNVCDNCPKVANPDQLDQDFDGAGNACDFDFGFAGVVEENVPKKDRYVPNLNRFEHRAPQGWDPF